VKSPPREKKSGRKGSLPWKGEGGITWESHKPFICANEPGRKGNLLDRKMLKLERGSAIKETGARPQCVKRKRKRLLGPWKGKGRDRLANRRKRKKREKRGDITVRRCRVEKVERPGL